MSRAFIKEDSESQDLNDLNDLAPDKPEAGELEDSESEGTKPAARARYITPEGFKALQDEAERLWKIERPKITAEVSAAAALGDRSENAEYLYGKKKLREIDRRLRYLSKRLDSLTVVPPRATVPDEESRVYFGAWVTVEDEDGAQSTYRIVGPDELDVRNGKISIDSPLAKALLGKLVGDEITVVRPKGSSELTVVEISYAQSGLHSRKGDP